MLLGGIGGVLVPEFTGCGLYFITSGLLNGFGLLWPPPDGLACFGFSVGIVGVGAVC